MYTFDEKKVTKELLIWLKEWFQNNGKGCNAIIGISGGKDSTIAAALCVAAIGKERVTLHFVRTKKHGHREGNQLSPIYR